MEAAAAAAAAAAASAPAAAALAQAPDTHDKALRNVLHAGGFDKGAKVWVPVQDAIGWVRARIVAKEEGAGGLTTFTVEEEGNGGGGHGGRRRALKSQRRPDGHFPNVHLVNEELDVAASEGEAGAIDDLIKLTHLHEPAILHTIELRYWRDTIYTFTGPILIAVNPFKPLPIYSDATLAAYRQAGEAAAARLAGQQTQREEPPALAPHIYAVADAAYRAMMGPLAAAAGGASPDQSILVSGESGAGKTESTKFIMQYLAIISTANSNNSKGVEEGSIADQVLQSNPILEAFGNARTIRNDNSSRFGKFIELHFAAPDGRLTGAAIATYLLEKVRLVSQAADERNFHVFYLLCSGASPEERAALRLGEWDGGKGAQAFHYLRQSGCVVRQDGADDAEEYRRLRRALGIMGVGEAEQARVLRVVAAVLHLGNLRFVSKAHGGAGDGGSSNSNLEAAAVAPDALGAARRVAELLQVDAEAFQRSLTDRTIMAGRESVTVQLTPTQAEGARDALAKAVYGNLFLWVVDRVNAAIRSQHQQQQQLAPAGVPMTPPPLSVRAGRPPSPPQQMFIGVLDIFGFESFRTNSFEQLCINYANEALQQQFNSFVFRLEQAEYEREEIAWEFVNFPDNEECLDLLENWTAGIFSLLDEQCTVPKGTDQSLANRLYGRCGPHPRFAVSSKDKVDFRFTVRHYAGDVTYDTAGFLEKNKDQLYQETVDLLASSACPLVHALADAGGPAGAASSAKLGGGGGGSPSGGDVSGSELGGSGGKQQQQQRRSAVAPLTVGTQFKGQLALLLARICATRPHYVRCLKPNDQNVAAAFDCPRIIEQLRCGGVLEAVRVSRAGYPTRMLHAQFNARYRPLALDAAAKAGSTRRSDGGEEDPAVSERRLATAIIGELGQILWAKWREEGLVLLPSEEEQAALALRERLAHVGLQLGKSKVFFRLQAFEELETLRGRLLRAMAVRCQAALRGWVRRKAYVRTRDAALVAQRLGRGYLARRRARLLRQAAAATRIQAAVRAQQAQKRLRAGMRVVLALQCLWRRERARRVLVGLREERAAVKVQAWARGRMGQRRWTKARAAALAVQTHFRRRLAKKELRRRRAEARDLNKVMAERDALKETVRGLKAELAQALEERDGRIQALEEEKAGQEERIRVLEAELAEALHLVEQKTVAVASPARAGNGGREEEEEGKADGEVSPPPSPAPSKATRTAAPAHAEIEEEEAAAEAARFAGYRERIAALEAQLAAKQAEVDVFRTGPMAFARGQTARCDSFVTAVSELGMGNGNGSQMVTRASSLALDDEGQDEGQAQAALAEAAESESEGSVSPAQTVEEAVAVEEAAAADAAAASLLAPPTALDSAALTPPPTNGVSDTPAPAFLLALCKKALEKETEEQEAAVLAMLEERLQNEGPASWPETVNAKDGTDGRTPLHSAAVNGSARLVALLLRHGAAPNMYDARDDTPLHLSANEGVTRALLAGGANPGLPNRGKQVALHVAVQKRDILSVQALLEKPVYRRCVNERDEQRRTPLHVAALVGLTDAVALLCGYDAHKEAADAEGFRPLHLICAASDQSLQNGPGIVHFLLDDGADPGCRTARGLTPLHLLCDNPAYDAHEAAVCQMADELLDHGVSPDVVAPDGATPLHLAARNNFEELSALLIRRGACLTIPWRLPGPLLAPTTSYDSAQESPPHPRSRAGSIASCSPAAGGDCVVGLESPVGTTAAEIFSPAQLQRMIGEITAPQESVPDTGRVACMECKSVFSLLNRRHHCRHCERLLCGGCASATLPREFFPRDFTADTRPSLRVCHICHAVLTKRHEKRALRRAAHGNNGSGGGGGGGGGGASPLLTLQQQDATQYVNLQDVVRARQKEDPEASAATAAAVEARAGEAPLNNSNGSGSTAGVGSPVSAGGGGGGGKKRRKKKKGGGGAASLPPLPTQML